MSHTIGEELECKPEGKNKCRSHAILVMAKETQKSNKKIKKTDHVVMTGDTSDALAQVLFPLMTSCKIYSARTTVYENCRVAAEGKLVPARGIEITCIYNIYRPKIVK